MELKVIIADDHSIVRMGLGSLIKQLGVNVVDEVSNCAELMSQLNNQTYSHLILDLIMPDGNALEIIENINNLYPNLTILIHSMQPVEVYGKIYENIKFIPTYTKEFLSLKLKSTSNHLLS
jgi:DNA-binding NarL/FixJ family response regulator